MMKINRPSPSDRWYKEEADLLTAVKHWLEPLERSDVVKVIRINDRYAKGYSDIFMCVRGIFVAAELKDDTGKMSPHQEDFIADIIRTGGIAGECRSVKDVSDLIDKAMAKVKPCACEKLTGVVA